MIFVFLYTLYADIKELWLCCFAEQFSKVACAVVDPAGLEPATPALSRRCSNQLSYGSDVPRRGMMSR